MTNVCGTVRTNRKHLPKIDKKNMAKNEMKTFSSSQMTYMAWKDKKMVTMLSTMHSAEKIVTEKVDYRTKERKVKPNIVLDYNQNMGGVDRSDQCITGYEIIRKSTKWHIKTFFHLLDMAIFNAYVVYNITHSDKKLKFLDYRMQLARELIDKYVPNCPRTN